MWVTFGLTILIGTAWITKMVVERRIFIQRTPLDIFILLFLLSQLISTIFSLDPYVSWWGYYSRWNGGFLSTFSYVFLYYAFVSNLSVKQTLKIFSVSLFTGLLVALWGFPSHFGQDPTCFVFRGSLDTSCWVDAFKPTIREFSTLGQPAWLAAYLAALLPLALAYILRSEKVNISAAKNNWKLILFLFLTAFFYINLIFAETRAGTIGFFVTEIIFWALLFYKKIFTRDLLIRNFIVFHVVLLVCSFLFGMPIASLNKFTLSGLTQRAAVPEQPKTPTTSAIPTQQDNAGITDSGKIRLYVWRGAIDAWKANPIFGTGVETFAFAYYKFRPVEHNLTSEWDFLYNKAHNEYLNYLTTTGIFGLGTYLAFIFGFIFQFFKYLLSKSHAPPPQPVNKHNKHHSDLLPLTSHLPLLSIALFVGWLSILITNFFGFSVVIMNLYLFLIPAFFFIINDLLLPEKSWKFSFGNAHFINPYQWTIIGIVALLAGFSLINLLTYWQADVAYALGQNLDHVGSYQQAYPLLAQAVKAEPGEPVYKDEFSINLATLATALVGQKDASSAAAEAANNAVALSTEVTTEHPNNVSYWKTRVKILYTLAQIDTTHQEEYMQQAFQAITKASELAPTDPKVGYNLGIIYGQLGDINKGIEVLKRTIAMKPDYRDSHFALGLLYHQQAVDKDGKVINPELQQKAIDEYQYILKNISPNDEEVKKTLKEWQKQ